MPALVKLYIRQVLIGFLLSAVFVAGLLYADVANLRHLVSATDAGPLAVFLLWLFNGIVFAGVQFGIAIMRMGRDEDRGSGGTRPAVPVLRPALAPVGSEAPGKRDATRLLRGR